MHGSQHEQGHDEDIDPPGNQVKTHSPDVVLVLPLKPATQLVAGPEMVEAAVALDRAWYLERWRAEQAGPRSDLPVERNHHLRGKKAIVTRPATRRIGDVVSDEIVGANENWRNAEGCTREVRIDDR